MRFATDHKNRLCLFSGKSVLHPRGRFSIDRHNRLVYWLNEPAAWRREYDLPGRIVWRGKWQLKPDGLLELAVDQPEKGVRRQALALRCKLVSVESGRIVFGLKSEEGGGRQQFSLLQLEGSWGSDDSNRMQFYLSRRKDNSLVFNTGWTVNDNQQLVVRLESFDRVRGRRIISEAELSGFWQVFSATRLRYILCAGSSSAIDFRVQLESANLRPVNGAMKFRLGSGMARSARGDRNLLLYGDWKFSRSLGLEFDIAYGLKSRRCPRSGLSVTFSRSLSRRPGGQAFVRLARRGAESRVDTGITIPF